MVQIVKARLKVLGRVQGVFYRQSTKQKAQGLGLSGWVKNENDGSVLIEATGPSWAMQDLISWCNDGPPLATVRDVQIEWLNVSKYETLSGKFEIVR